MAVKKKSRRKAQQKNVALFFRLCFTLCYKLLFILLTVSRSERFNVYRNRTINRVVLGMLYRRISAKYLQKSRINYSIGNCMQHITQATLNIILVSRVKCTGKIPNFRTVRTSLGCWMTIAPSNFRANNVNNTKTNPVSGPR